MHWKNFLYFSLTEKIAVLILVVIIVISFGLNVLLSKGNSAPVSIPQNDSIIAAFQRLQDGLEDNMNEKSTIDYNSKSKNDNNSLQRETRNSTEINHPRHYSDQPKYEKQEKFTETSAISLNETDTAQWKMVPGIGSSFSARIVKYREKLGGYISINQLKEVYGITDEVFDNIAPFIREDNIGANQFAKLKINKLEFKEILAHPYISFEQTKAIVNFRKRTGNITSLNELAMLDEFTSEDIRKLAPYIEF